MIKEINGPRFVAGMVLTAVGIYLTTVAILSASVPLGFVLGLILIGSGLVWINTSLRTFNY